MESPAFSLGPERHLITKVRLLIPRLKQDRDGLNNITFRVGSATDLDLGPFDIVLCDYLLEHVEDPNSLISVIARHLEPHGAYFLSTNNKWWPLEGHYGLPIPLISWLPRAWANRYVRLMGFGTEYSVYPISWNRLEELLERNELTWSLKPPTRPYTAAQKVGKRLVQISPAFWKIANVFQVVGRRKETAK